MNVAILCTGEMELRGLKPALERLFDGHTFEPIGEFEALPGVDAKPLPEFASDRVVDKHALDQESVLRKRIIPRAAAALWEGYDRVILLSDLELANMERAPYVCDVVKQAIRLHLQNLNPRFAADTNQKFRERASFHLAVPMVDSWLFGDPAVCQKNKIPPGRTPLLTSGRDREQFLTADPGYEADDGSACSVLLERAARGAERKKALWVKERRTEHPKHYLQWLCRDPSEKDCTTWRETGAGAEALAQLDWGSVLTLANEYAFLHALVEDLADALNEPEPFIPPVRIHVPTRLRPPSERTCLRNECDYGAFGGTSDP